MCHLVTGECQGYSVEQVVDSQGHTCELCLFREQRTRPKKLINRVLTAPGSAAGQRVQGVSP